jgi:hypothetical protein
MNDRFASCRHSAVTDGSRHSVMAAWPNPRLNVGAAPCLSLCAVTSVEPVAQRRVAAARSPLDGKIIWWGSIS